MAITIGSNNIDSNTTDITFYTNGGTYAQQVNATSGRTGIYPSFTAACTYEGWRYHGQLGGANAWRETSTWGLNGYWVADQRSPGSYGHDATTGRYYAPVSGYYMFGMNVYVGNDANNSSGYFHMNFLKNGGVNYNGLGRHAHSLFGHDTTNFYVDGVTVENVIYCDQGQYVCPGPYMGGGNGRIYMGHYQFYGHLLP